MSRFGRSFHGSVVGPALALLIAVVAAAPAAARQASAELELRLRQAERKLQQGDTVGALLDVEAVLGRDQAFARAYVVRGRIQARMGDDLGARDSFTRAAELDPGNAELHFLVASVATQLADFEAARRQLINAAQAGYDPSAVHALAASLRDYLETPLDLTAPMSAPRVAVDALTEDEDRALEALVRELRTLLLEAPEVALVHGAANARYAVTIARTGGEGPSVVRVELIDRDTGEVALTRELTGDGAQARVEMGDLSREIAGLAAR